MDDAKRMKTTEYKDGKKETISLADKYNWKQMPQIMMKWRAVAACARVVFPDVVLGLYTPDEMGANTDANTGEIIGLLEAPAQIHSLPTKSANSQPADKIRQPGRSNARRAAAGSR
jgi:hypothetical protein